MHLHWPRRSAGALGKTVEPSLLALSAVRFDAARAVVGFAAEGARWSWDGDSAALQRLGRAFGPEAAVAPGGDAAVSNVGPDLQLRLLDDIDQPGP